jgi:adenylylsulfate kinase-like enzyme
MNTAAIDKTATAWCGQGKVIWITGLSGAGKTTTAKQLSKLMNKVGETAVLLDGDDLRLALGYNGKYDESSRRQIAQQYSKICKLISDQGFTVIISTISMFHEIHAWNRKNLHGYYEIYLRADVEELKKRDPKGLYQKFSKGKIQGLAGIDQAIEEPRNPDQIIDMGLRHTPTRIAEKIMQQVFGDSVLQRG